MRDQRPARLDTTPASVWPGQKNEAFNKYEDLRQLGAFRLPRTGLRTTREVSPAPVELRQGW
jgi:hypothetical protein